MTSFSGLVRANSALQVASYGLEITGENISNADTDGYTRQRAEQVSVGADSNVPSLYVHRQTTDQGVAISGTTRLNDPVIDAQDRVENSRSSYASSAATTMSDVENAFPEPTSSGLSSALSSFYASWSALSNNANSNSTSGTTSSALRTDVLSAATSVTTALHTASQQLSDTLTNLQSQLSDTVSAANSSATQLAQINNEIKSASDNNLNTNSLADQRDTVLDALAKSVGGVATINADGSATVMVGGQTLVSGNTATALSVNATTSAVSVGSTAVTMTTGQAGSLVNDITTTVPNYQSQLNTIAANLASTVNTLHESGYDASGTAGGAFFNTSDGTATVTAANINVAITDGSKIAASSTQTTGGNSGAGVAVEIFNLGSATGGVYSQYTTLVNNVASASAAATNASTVQASVTSTIDAQRTSASGVNYDEEVTNLLMYQRSYQAASRVLTTVDSTLDTLINHTGVVGL